jgi:hypothetical protein
MMHRILCIAGLLLGAQIAHGATNLATVNQVASCSGKPVSTEGCGAQFQKTPSATDLVRTCPGTITDLWSNAACIWKPFGSLAVGDRYEVCADNLADDPTPAVAPWCSTYPFLAKVAAVDLESVATGVDNLITAGKSISGRASTTLLVADRNLIRAGLAAIGSTDVHAAIAPKASTPTTPAVPTTPTLPMQTTAKKWNPGHYLRANEQAFAYQRANRNRVWDMVRAEPLLKGGLVVVPWGSIERNAGEYDFSEVDADVATLKAMGKKLIIEVWWMNYWGDMPTTPSAGFNAWVPDHLIAKGCLSRVPNTANGKGYTVQLHRQECMDPLIAVFQALGKRYDGNDTVEQIIITEPSTPYAEQNKDQFHEQFKRLIPAVAKAWPHTGVVFYMNWYPYSRDLFVNYMLPNGVGVGGPDIIPAYRPVQDDGSSVLQGLGGDKGTTDYRGRIPISYSYEASIKDGPPAQLIGYAMNNLKCTHIAWVPSSTGNEAGFGYADGVLPAIKSVSGKTVTTYPSAWPK